MSTKTIAITAASALVVSGAVVGGVYMFNDKPQLAVVQRSTSVSVPPGSEASAVASCLSHETNLNGGYGFDGAAYATSSVRVEPGSWQVGAYNPTDEPVTLTAYAVCVNARVSVSIGTPVHPTAFSDRAVDKILGRDTDLTTVEPMKDWYRRHADPMCRTGLMVGITFRPGRSVPSRPVAPVPLTAAIPENNYSAQVWLNSGTRADAQIPVGTELSTRNTRIPHTQPPEWNFRSEVAAVCVSVAQVNLATATVDVAGGSAADAALRCPTGQHPVGGGFDFPDHREFGGWFDGKDHPAEFIDDGWMFATVNAPARDEASGSRIRTWHVTGVNQQTPGAYYANSVWYAENRNYLRFGRVPAPGERSLRPFIVPPSSRMTASVVCARITAEPVAPPKEPEPPRVAFPDPLPAIELSPAGASPVTPTPTPTATTAPNPTRTAATAPTPTPTAATAPTPTRSPAPTVAVTPGPARTTPTQKPQKPAVSIQSPPSGGELCAGQSMHFAGTAKSEPSNQLITDAKYTRWQIIDAPGGSMTLGAGASGDFLVSANLPVGASFTLAFTATDPNNGLSGKDEVTVSVASCG